MSLRRRHCKYQEEKNKLTGINFLKAKIYLNCLNVQGEINKNTKILLPSNRDDFYFKVQLQKTVQ